jgi:carbohydrate binding protein with CBM35 domain
MKNIELNLGGAGCGTTGLSVRSIVRALSLKGVLLSGALALAACGEAPESTASLTQTLSQTRIEGEAFNRFFDTDSAHSGNCGTGPVDAEVTTDPKGGTCNIGWTAAGEWLEYDVNIASAGNYDFILRLASGQTNRTVHLEVDGVNRSGAITSPAAGFQAFADRTVSNISLNAGPHVVRIAFDTGSVNLNYFELIQTSVAPEVILSADFAAGLDAFYYVDQSADDTVDGVQANGRLQMTLGGKDNTTVRDMRGSFNRMFWVSTYQEVTLKFDYVLEQSCAYETDEASELLATMDYVPLTTGSNPFIARVVGNGNACPGVVSSGTYTKTFVLGQGKHTLQITGFNNQKTSSDEFTTLTIDNVLITASATQCTPALSQTFTNLCNACDGLLNCQGACTVNFPSNVGAPCGSCGGVVKCDGTCSEPLSAPCGAPPTPAERHLACAKDPRVVAGLVTRDVCTGADVFFRETFGGNGRTCASCHPIANNYTIDPPFVQALLAAKPNDPLFVSQPGTPLQHLETPDLVANALILENVDGFQDPANRFVTRSVPHLFSLAITMAPDPADGSPTTPPIQRTGWGGDGAPGDGSLRSFLDGAINQHFTKTLNRVPGVDFRAATDLERDTVESFQLALGRQNELNLANVNFALPLAQDGKGRFLDPAQGRCGVCHANAGANFVKSGRNRNFNNGAPISQSFGRLVNYFGPGQDLTMVDGGFGGSTLTAPNVDPTGIGFFDGFGDGNFNVPPLVEAADTAPFFHSNAQVGSFFQSPMERIVFFYGTSFQFSKGAQFLDSQPEFGPGDINATTTGGIPQMLVVLNAVFNIDLARQRLQAAETLATDLHAIRADVQAQLMLLAGEEIEDAIRVLREQSIHQTQQDTLQSILNQVRTANAGALWSTRRSLITTALANLNAVRPQFGSNFDYQLGAGTLMY